MIPRHMIPRHHPDHITCSPRQEGRLGVPSEPRTLRQQPCERRDEPRADAPRPKSAKPTTRLHRKAQMEMIGLVFIVVIIVIGIVLYISSSNKVNRDDGTGQAQGVQKSTSFLTALAETRIPACGVPLSRVVQACVNDEVFCDNGDPCKTLQRTFDKVAAHSLYEQGMKYNLSVEGTAVQNISGCNSSSVNTRILAAPRQPIPLTNGQQTYLVLSICR